MVPETYLEDASGFRGYADRLLTPASTEEVSAILREASAAAIPVTLSGAGTGVTGGRCAQGGWLLSLEKFKTIEIHPGWARAGAGVPLNELQAAAAPTGQFYAPDPTEWTASVGGTIACNASGSRSFLYGSTRRHVLALTAVFASGEIRTFERGERVDFPLPALPLPQTTKNSAGYLLQPGMEWIDLLCGSEGTLAAVTEARLRLLPIPESMLSGVVFFAREERMLDAVEAWRGVEGLRMLESIDAVTLEIARPRYPEIPHDARAALLVEQIVGPEGCDAVVDAWVERLDTGGALGDASWFGENAADRERFRKFRHTLPEMVNDRVRRNGFQKLGSDFAVPFDRNREMYRFYRAKVDQDFSGKGTLYGHVGDGHVHVNLLPESPEEETTGKAIMLEFAREAVRLGGTVSAEHGLGKKKAHLLALQYTASQVESMKAVKRRLDPQWLLGRGTLFPAE
ncbi:MAG: FAD-binding oxidoreductase [Bryobacterales bacterium]|nr:FAD-binding oxidoreductase [Bryobacterales bacterium]